MSTWATEKNANGLCDRCSFRYPLSKLRKERDNLNQQSLRVCPSCWDEDHPQNSLGRIDHSDAQALRDPRPQRDLADSRTDSDIVENFTDDVTNWTASGGAGGSAVLTHDATNGYAQVVYTNSYDPQLQNIADYSFDATQYTRVRIRVKITETSGSIISGTRQGIHQLFWERSGEGFSGSRRKDIPIDLVALRGFGDKWQEILFDLEGVTDYDGTITGIRFDYFNGFASEASDFTMQVDWIKIEKKIR